MSSFHSKQVLGEVHGPVSFEYANQAAREAATGFTSTDVHKFAVQLDDDSIWRLSDISPVTWMAVGNGEVTEAELAAVSGVLQGQITDLSNDLLTVSGFLQDQIDDLVIEQGVQDAFILSVSGTLQGQLTSLDSTVDALIIDLNALDSYVDAVSGNLQGQLTNLSNDLLTTSGTLQSQITSLDGDITALEGLLTTTSGTLQSQLTDLEQDLLTTSGSLQNQIDDRLDNVLPSGMIIVGNSSDVATEVAVTGDFTINHAGVGSINPGVIVNADINTNAAIDLSKLEDVSGQILLGRHAGGAGSIQEIQLDGGLEWNGAFVRRAALTGDITASAGSNTTAIASGVIVNADINASAGIQFSKMEALTASGVVVTDGAGLLTTMSGISLTELGYLDGVTSNIQTQIDNAGGQPADSYDFWVQADISGTATTPYPYNFVYQSISSGYWEMSTPAFKGLPRALIYGAGANSGISLKSGSAIDTAASAGTVFAFGMGQQREFEGIANIAISSSASNKVFRFGFDNSNPTDTASRGAYFYMTGGTMYCKVRNSSSETVGANSYAMLGRRYCLHLYQDGTNFEFRMYEYDANVENPTLVLSNTVALTYLNDATNRYHCSLSGYKTDAGTAAIFTFFNFAYGTRRGRLRYGPSSIIAID
jgi:hypothetical protein